MDGIIIVLASGFAIGILGSIHCIGMCGPLALSLPIHQLSSWNKSLAIVLYNIGRSLSYGFLGLVFGIIGMSFSLFKIQQWLSVGAGIAILMIVLLHHFGYRRINFLSVIANKLKVFLAGKLSVDKSNFSYLTIGLANGFLPCGLVYVALASSVASGTMLNGGLLMFSFGMGTIPIMALTMIFGKFVSFSAKSKLNRLTPYLIMGVAILLILRGLNLGIPLISPILENGQMQCCHKK